MFWSPIAGFSLPGPVDAGVLAFWQGPNASTAPTPPSPPVLLGVLVGLATMFALWLMAVGIMLVRDWWGFRHDMTDDERESSDRWERHLRIVAEHDRELEEAAQLHAERRGGGTLV